MTASNIVALLVLTLAALALSAALPSHAALLPRSAAATTKSVVQTSGTNKCLDTVNGTLANGSKVQIKTCAVGSLSQSWQLQAATVGGKTVLQTSNGFCLDVPNGKGANNAALQVWTCNKSSTNQFFATDGTNIVWNGSQYCLDVSHGTSSGFVDNLPVVLYQCSMGSKNQFFVPTTASTSASTTIATSTPPASATLSVAHSTVTTSITPTSTPLVTTHSTSTTLATVSTTKSTSTSATPSPTFTQVAKPALTSVFKPQAKRMLAYGYDDRVAGGIGSGPLISSYHHWQDNVIPQMPAKDTFIPTYWGTSMNASWAAVKATLGSTIPPVVMSFNEPDVPTQANMTPSYAAQVFYNEITIPFGRLGSNVVSPAIVWNINGWLVPFMSACAQLGCNIDALGQHIYVGINGDVNNAIASVKNQINTMYNTFKKPIILSEVGLTEAGGGTDAEILEFVEGIGSFLDSTSYVLAWALSAVFSTGNGWDGYLNSNMSFFNDDETLTSLGYLYMNTTFS